MTINVIALSINSYIDGFRYPQEFLEAMEAWWPRKAKESELAKIFHESLDSSDRLVGRFLDDSRLGGDQEADHLYNLWCEIDDLAPKRPTGDEGAGEGFSVRRLDRR